MLNDKTIKNLAKVLTPEVIDYVYQSEEFIELLHTLVPAAIDSKLGEIDDDLAFDLALCVMDRITLTERKY